jgi:hypothetical protein
LVEDQVGALQTELQDKSGLGKERVELGNDLKELRLQLDKQMQQCKAQSEAAAAKDTRMRAKLAEVCEQAYYTSLVLFARSFLSNKNDFLIL